MDSQLTIIVPVYNAEKVLPACLDSLRAQTVPVRVCIVDDASSDATPALAAAAAKSSPLVTFTALPHGGPSIARRRGATLVNTPYLAFLDADDTLAPRFAERMLETAAKHHADIVFCPYRCIYDGVPRQVSYPGSNDVFELREYPIRKQPSLLLSVPVYFWAKIFKTDFFKTHVDMHPPLDVSLSPIEDIPSILPLLLQAPRMAKCPDPLHHYSIYSSSFCHATHQELTRLPALRELHRRFKELKALPDFLPQLYALNRCYLFDQLERLRNYVDPPHQHRVVREYFRHLDSTLPGWRPHPFHPTFYAAYWHAVVTWNALRKKRRS